MTQELSISEIGHQMYMIRSHRVMFDSALAKFYQIETKALKRAVKRNITRFPSDFMFELNDDDMKSLRCQIGTSKLSVGNGRGGNRYTTFAFTEPGVAMLSSVLKSERAVQVNIAIIRAFIELRKGSDINRTEVSKIELFDDRLGKLENKLSQVLEQMKTLTKTGSQASENPTQAELVSCRSARPIEKIQNAVARYFGIKEQSLKLAGRENSIVLPRQIAMHLVRKHLGTSFKDIGRHFGDRDHTTVMYACKRIGLGLEQGALFKEDIRAIEKALCLDTTVLHAFRKISTAVDQDEVIREAIQTIESLF